jgi:hypothetical protein
MSGHCAAIPMARSSPFSATGLMKTTVLRSLVTRYRRASIVGGITVACRPKASR